MYVQMMVPECDFTGTVYDKPVMGAGGVCRGATGRYCVVMYAGPEYLASNGIVPITEAEAYRTIEENGDGFPDF